MPGRLLMAVLAAVVVGGAGLAFLVLRPSEIATRQGQPDQGSASTFVRPAGFEVTVSDVHVPDAAGRVTVAVSFHNTSTVQQRADLHPAGGASQSPRDPDARQVGTEFGPVPLCFEVAHGATDGPTLVWEPDIGLIGTPVAIPLR